MKYFKFIIILYYLNKKILNTKKKKKKKEDIYLYFDYKMINFIYIFFYIMNIHLCKFINF